MSDQKKTIKTWSRGDYVALGARLEVVASAPSRQRAKEKAIAVGVASPLVVPASRLKASATS
jgi:hypothetical protein